MAYFNYRLVPSKNRLSAASHEVLAEFDNTGPGCTKTFNDCLVASIIELDSPNPLIQLNGALGIDGVEKICAVVREYKEVRDG